VAGRDSVALATATVPSALRSNRLSIASETQPNAQRNSRYIRNTISAAAATARITIHHGATRTIIAATSGM
jgi:hypothetical protein